MRNRRAPPACSGGTLAQAITHGHPGPQACTRQGQPEQGTAPGHSGRGRLATGSATTLDFSDGHAHMCTLDLARALGKGRQQGLVGQQVDGADAPTRGLGQLAQRARLEQRPALPARPAQAVLDVGRSIGAVQGLQLKAVHHPVAHLAQLGQGQQRVQLGLAEEHDLQQLVLGRFQVGQELDLLQRFGRHGLRLVDEHHRAPPLGVALQQSLLDGQHQGLTLGRGLQTPIGNQGLQDFTRTERGIGQIDQIDLIARQALGQHTAQHGFAAADLPHHHDDAVFIEHRVVQGIQDGTARLPLEKELAVRRDAKRRLTQAEVFKVEGGQGKFFSDQWFMRNSCK